MTKPVGPKVNLYKTSLSGLGRDAVREARKAAHFVDGTSKKGATLPQHSDKVAELSRGRKKSYYIDPCGLGHSRSAELVPGDKVQVKVRKKGFLNLLFGKVIQKDVEVNTKDNIFVTAKKALDELGEHYWKKDVKKRAKSIKKATLENQMKRVEAYKDKVMAKTDKSDDDSHWLFFLG